MFFRLDRISKRYGDDHILDDISFSAERGESISIIGPSGVGKTTLLKIIAGLEKPTSGTLTFEHPPSKERPVILVFQDYLLFPAMTVFQNVAFGLRARKLPKADIQEKVTRMLAYFGLSDKKDAYPAHLSAGQKQRVAIARAMVVNPSIILLDEPFANLDKNLKGETAAFLRKTQQEFGITMITVTHDLDEAFGISDRIGIMLGSTLAQIGTPAELYRTPVNLPVARFMGELNTIQQGEQQWFVRPEWVNLKQNPHGTGTVTAVTFAGGTYRVQVASPLGNLTAVTLENGYTVGSSIDVTIQEKIYFEGNAQ